MRDVKGAQLAAVAGAVVLATTISACTSDSTTSDERVSSYSAQQSVEQFAGIDFDYDPVASPSALAEQSSLVVTGTIDRVQEGRVQIVPENTEAPGISTIVLVLRDPKTVVGSVGEGSDGFVYIELPNPGSQESDAYQGGLRAGSAIVAYLVPASEGAPVEGVDTAITDSKAGRPAGQALYLPAGPQALILQHENEAVVWPLIGEKRDGRLEDTLPGGKLIAP